MPYEGLNMHISHCLGRYLSLWCKNNRKRKLFSGNKKSVEALLLGMKPATSLIKNPPCKCLTGFDKWMNA